MADRQPVPEPTSEEWERFWSYVRNAYKEGCWEWIGGRFSNGYGCFVLRGRPRRAHRVLYVWENGEPENDLDHLCNNRACVNPGHLRPFPTRENVLRGEGPTAINARKIRPDCGHDEKFTYVDPRGWRGCRQCRKEAVDRYRKANKDRINAERRERRRVQHKPRPCPTCGSLFTPARSSNVYCSRPCQWTASNHQRAEQKRADRSSP